MKAMSFKNSQTGMATLMISFIMVVVISLMSVYSAQVAVMEQRISANHYRAKQAFEAAQAGVDAALMKFDVPFAENVLPNANSTGTETTFANNNRTLPSLSTMGSNHQSVGKYKVKFNRSTRNNKANNDIVEFTLAGFSGDNTSTSFSEADQTISQSFHKTKIIHNLPAAALVAWDDISVGGTSSSNRWTITYTGADVKGAVWCGDGLTTNSGGSNASLTGYRYQSHAALKNLTKDTDNNDNNVNNNDTFFTNWFSENRKRLRNRSVVIDCENGCDGESVLTGYFTNNAPKENNIFWIDANNNGVFANVTFNNSSTWGTADNPILIIVDGNFVISNGGGSTFNGMIYSTRTMDFGGNDLIVNGILVSESDIKGTGDVNITYDVDVLGNLQDNTSFYTRIAGTWKDF